VLFFLHFSLLLGFIEWNFKISLVNQMQEKQVDTNEAKKEK
jgi:hypothetical protein